LVINTKSKGNFLITQHSDVQGFFAPKFKQHTMRLKFLFISLFIFTLSFAQNTGTITGTITDKDLNNEPLPFASVAIKGTNIGATTDENGQYSINVPAGSHTLVFGFLGYENIELPITIAAGETKTINQAMGSTSVQLQDVVIEKVFNREKEEALLLEQKNAVEIKQSIGAQEIARKGISDVEEGLTKVTGISKVESRGLFIRGLENRYNNLLVNDFAVPSNSPFNKIIPLDLFPTDIVGYMDIFKTFNTDIYGDFAGGTVNIHTAQSTGSKTKISVGVGYTTDNNGRDFLMASDATNSKTYFGLGNSDRELPGVFGDRTTGRRLTAEESNKVFKSGFDVEETSSPLNTSFGVTHTGKFNVGENDSNSVNYIFSTNYDNKYIYRKGVDRTFIQEQGIYDNNLTRTQYRFQTSSSTLLGAQYRTNRAKINFNALYIRTTDNTIQDQEGYTRNAVQNPNQIIRLNQYEQSDFFTAQLFGDYSLTEDGNHSVRGGLSFSNTKFSQPDRKFIDGVRIDENNISITYGGNNLLRQFLKIDGDSFISGLAEYNYKFGENEAGDERYKLTVGYNGFSSGIETSYRFIFGRPNNSPPAAIVPINQIDSFLEESIAAGQFAYAEESTDDYQTKLTQNVHAGYTSFLMKVSDKFELNFGVRAESTIRDLEYRPIGSGNNSPFRNQQLSKLYILPSLNAKYLLNENSNLRFTASKTLTNPILMEAIPINYVNADGTIERGNKDLVNSENYNVDLKFESFPTNKELFAATLFAKHIDKPIERTIQANATGSGQIITYYNNKNATLFGLELESIIQLSRFSEMLDNFSFGLNTSIMYTQSVANTNRDGYFDTFEKRKLQGASDWMGNADIKYESNFSENWKNSMSFVYNVYGPRIYAIGVAGMDHIYENPFHKLDFVWINNISEKWEVKFAVDNILNQEYTQEVGDESKRDVDAESLVVKSFRRGVGFSLNLSYIF
jgi:outer membrane receptor protein involved in Fe transport